MPLAAFQQNWLLWMTPEWGSKSNPKIGFADRASPVSTPTARPVAWLTHEGSGLRLHLRRSYQSARSFLLPTQGADTFEYRDLHVKLLPKLAFFALWDAPVLGTPAIITEYLIMKWMTTQMVKILGHPSLALAKCLLHPLLSLLWKCLHPPIRH